MTLTETLTMSTRFAMARRRRAFSLVELLVVIGIIISLMALTGVAVQKTVESQKYKTTQEQLTKGQTTINLEYGKIVSEVSNAPDPKAIIPPAVFSYCDNDLERARAVWMAMRLRQQFPENFAEATRSLYISNNAGILALTDTPPTTGTVIYTLKPLATFAKVGAASGGSAGDESGALLYLILVEKSNAGSAMSASGDTLGATKEVTFGSVTLKTYVDAWGRSVGFRRWFGCKAGEDEPQQSQYGSTSVLDQLDPKNRINATIWPDGQTTGRLLQLQTILSFNSRIRLATNYSLGKDPSDPTDDIIGFRLNRPGTTGRTP